MDQGEKTVISSTRFGEIEVDKSLFFEFSVPIIGYDKHKFFALVDNKPDSPFKWLQSAEDPELAFPITLPSYFNIDYTFTIEDADADLLGLEKAEDVMAINIVNIPHDCPQNATVNLLAPIVINTNTNSAMQIILKNKNYQIKHPLF